MLQSKNMEPISLPFFKFSEDTQRYLAAPPKVNVLLPSKKWSENTGGVSLGKDMLKIGKRLGGGTYGNVYAAEVKTKDKKKGGKNVYLKVAVKFASAGHAGLTGSVIGETMAMHHMSASEACYPRMMCLYGVVVTKMSKDPADKEWRYGLVMELMDGDLHSLATNKIAVVKKMKPEVRFAWLMYITGHMLYALYYMHFNGYASYLLTYGLPMLTQTQPNRWAHNDVKPANYLYKWPAGAARPTVKISDFGLACNVAKDCGKANRQAIDFVVADYSASIGVPPPPTTPMANERCAHTTTPFYQMPKWDSVYDYGRPTSGIQENFENDMHCVSMSVRALFAELGFERKEIVAPYNIAGVDPAYKGAQVAAWGSATGGSSSSRLRAAKIPFEFLSEPFRAVAERFSRTVDQMASGAMMVDTAVDQVVEQLSDALKIVELKL